ncbi:probable serine/threonine-protein kinase DDB_G0280133 [Lucilia sericata]|uniref:probable serine/threonine-protein kinase DDB_G0280133 n=1 Tax=Lucilia sericata TaxID=13632 RepID=UPI0018A862A1|nr:probable serine/threonine-protein kinase DDB_G0280133 [Lucilia sericata]
MLDALVSRSTTSRPEFGHLAYYGDLPELSNIQLGRLLTKTATQVSTAAAAKPIQTRSHSQQPPPPLLPLTLATTAIATATAAATGQPKATKEKESNKMASTVVKPMATLSNIAAPNPAQGIVKKIKVLKREDKVLVKRNSEIEQKPKVLVKRNSETEQKRPGTTEWEKFADMLAQVRKFNPQDALRRGGTFSKFGTGNGRPSYFGHHTRSGLDDDSSDTTSNFRGSPINSQRSSARAGGRVQRLPNRPNTGNHRKNHHEFSSNNAGGRFANKTRRNSNVSSSSGRKFDFNPTRSRLNELVKTVSSSPLTAKSLLQTTITQKSSAPSYYQTYESVKSPANMRSHHSRNDTRNLPPLDSIEHNHYHHHKQQQQQHLRSDYALTSSAYDQHHHHQPHHTGSSMPLQSDAYSNDPTSLLIRQSSNTSLFSNSSYVDNLHSSYKSTTQLDVMSLNPPVKNTSSFLSTPRTSPFSIRKSYTDLYFTTSSNKENTKPCATSSELCSRDKSPYKVRKRCDSENLSFI